MSDFSFSVRCPHCGGRFAPDDGSCCEPQEDEGEEEAGDFGLTLETDHHKKEAKPCPEKGYDSVKD